MQPLIDRANAQGATHSNGITLNEQYTLAGHPNVVTSIRFSGDGRRISTSAMFSLYVWDLTSRKRTEIPGHLDVDAEVDGVNQSVISPDGKSVAVVDESRGAKIWNIAKRTTRIVPLPKQELVGTAKNPLDRFYKYNHVCLDVSADGRFLAVGSRVVKDAKSSTGTIRIFDFKTLKLLHTIQTGSGAIRSLAFSPDGRWLASGNEGSKETLRIWKTATGKLHRVIRDEKRTVLNVRFSPDGKMLAATGYFGKKKYDENNSPISMPDILKMYDVTTGKMKFKIPSKIDINAFSFSRCGNIVALTTDRKLQLWEFRNEKLLKDIKGKLWSVVAFSPVSDTLVASYYIQEGKPSIDGGYLTVWKYSGLKQSVK